jgi:hypothetical protein
MLVAIWTLCFILLSGSDASNNWASWCGDRAYLIGEFGGDFMDFMDCMDCMDCSKDNISMMHWGPTVKPGLHQQEDAFCTGSSSGHNFRFLLLNICKQNHFAL